MRWFTGKTGSEGINKRCMIQCLSLIQTVIIYSLSAKEHFLFIEFLMVVLLRTRLQLQTDPNVNHLGTQHAESISFKR